jgi:hypothetical protein
MKKKQTELIQNTKEYYTISTEGKLAWKKKKD